ncbi:hypothetical protein NQ315_009735 [Exocentrus adspersus]|uniref:Coiled-coil-helix-coiled-coil-helix domain-containing protein 1 n=1 Tax=Exocentrus adspersus TaxID=1586481 RepID=A0AAV8WH77_9CUCU|nr:hypothetical protein NQ315_009735 [Exocentrus adspersus]
MSVMLSCFKENEFDQSFCSKEVEAFRKCYDNHMEMKKVKKAKDAKGLLTPEQKVLSHKQVNRLLKQFPNIK